MKVFHKPGDDAAFVKLLGEAQDHTPMRLVAWCLMPNHFHLVVWPPGSEKTETSRGGCSG